MQAVKKSKFSAHTNAASNSGEKHITLSLPTLTKIYNVDVTEKPKRFPKKATRPKQQQQQQQPKKPTDIKLYVPNKKEQELEQTKFIHKNTDIKEHIEKAKQTKNGVCKSAIVQSQNLLMPTRPWEKQANSNQTLANICYFDSYLKRLKGTFDLSAPDGVQKLEEHFFPELKSGEPIGDSTEKKHISKEKELTPEKEPIEQEKTTINKPSSKSVIRLYKMVDGARIVPENDTVEPVSTDASPKTKNPSASATARDISPRKKFQST